MQIRAHFHGAPGRLPFIGHFRAQHSADGLALAAAGTVAGRADVSTAFRAAREVEMVLSGLRARQAADRHDLLNMAWSLIGDIAGCDLGPHGGEDLCILFAARDKDGIGIAGMGLGGVWTFDDERLQPLVTGDHPLLGGPGRPARLPGVLTLDDLAHTIVAVSHDHPVPTLSPVGLAERCGVRA